jgi:hypothetical protein
MSEQPQSPSLTFSGKYGKPINYEEIVIRHDVVFISAFLSFNIEGNETEGNRHYYVGYLLEKSKSSFKFAYFANMVTDKRLQVISGSDILYDGGVAQQYADLDESVKFWKVGELSVS